MDANADRLPDYCRVVGVVGNQLLRCGIADGTRIVKEWDYRVEDWGDDWSRAWTDANGDGAADYCRVSGKGDASLCSYGSGAGQFSEYRWSAPRADQPEGRRWSDVTATT